MDVRLPDGTVLQNVPDGMSKADLTAKLKANGYDVSTLEPAAPTGAPVSRLEKIGRGMKDPLDGAAQLFEKLMPQGFNNANRSVNNWLADKTGLLSKMPEDGVNGLIQQQEADYQAKRAAAGESGFDGYRTIGNVASPMNLALAAKLPAAASLAGRVGVGALGGAASGALNPSKNVNLDILKSEGIKPTIGQTLGGWANRAEEKAQSIPILGDAITAARKAGEGQLNRAAFNRALAPVGEKLPMNVPLGDEAVEHTGKVLGAAYDKLLPKLTTQADDVFAFQPCGGCQRGRVCRENSESARDGARGRTRP